MYFQMVGQFKKQLAQVDKWLDTVAAFAQAKKIEPDVFLGFRLSPDQFAFARQIQIACDTAKTAVARISGPISGKEAPKHADDEKTLAELQTRIRSVVAYLDGFTAQDFAEAGTRVVTQPRWEGKTMTGADYFVEHAVPNFFFHVTTAYAILRHNGVEIGKKDYLGALTFQPKA